MSKNCKYHWSKFSKPTGSLVIRMKLNMTSLFKQRIPSSRRCEHGHHFVHQGWWLEICRTARHLVIMWYTSECLFQLVLFYLWTIRKKTYEYTLEAENMSSHLNYCNLLEIVYKIIEINFFNLIVWNMFYCRKEKHWFVSPKSKEQLSGSVSIRVCIIILIRPNNSKILRWIRRVH